MTSNTNRNNIKPMLFSIAFMMMILFGLFVTKTLQSVGPRQFACHNSKVYSRTGRTFIYIFFSTAFLCCFAFFGPAIPSGNGLSYCPSFCSFGILASSFTRYLPTFFCLPILLNMGNGTAFTAICTVAFSGCVFIKFHKWLDVLACETSSRYNLLRHLLLRNRSTCLGPVTGTYQWSAHSILANQFYLSTNLGK